MKFWSKSLLLPVIILFVATIGIIVLGEMKYNTMLKQNQKLAEKYSLKNSVEKKQEQNSPKITEKYKGMKWNAIGDSITALDGYESIVQKTFGIANYNNYGKKGYTTEMLIGDIDSWDNNADIITFFAGTNDFGRCLNLSVTKKSVDTIFSSFKAKYPNKIIYVLLPIPRWGYTGDTFKGQQTTMTNSNGVTLQQYCDTIKEVATAYGFPVVDLYNESGITKDNISSYTTDGLHPNSDGMNKIAQVIIQKLNSQ